MSSEKNAAGIQPGSQNAIAALYQRSLLDPLVEIAHAVAHDVLRRPRRYRDVSEKTGRLLDGFRNLTGSHPDWPSATQRAALYGSLHAHGFCAGSIGLWRAAISFTEQATDKNEATLAQSVRDELTTFRAFLKTVDGPPLSAVDRQTGAMFKSAVEVFQEESLARAFGLPAVGAPGWPFGASNCGDSAYLVQEISRVLRLWGVGIPMTQRRFLLLQRAAHYGAQTIAGVLASSGDPDAKQSRELIQNAYGWERAMRGLFLKVNVIKAWKDPEYRETLTHAEKALLPCNPAGDVDLTDTELDSISARMRNVGLGFRTQTVGDAICCCTGDLPCGQASEGGYCNPTNVGFTCPVTDCGSGCTILT